MLDFGQSLNDVLGFLTSYNALPMSAVAQGGYNLANRSLADRTALANRGFDLQALSQTNAMKQFEQQLALQKMAQLWNQQFQEDQFGLQKDMALRSLPTPQSGNDAYSKAMSLVNNGVVAPNDLGEYYDLLHKAGVGSYQPPVVNTGLFSPR